jgi:magnesium transporter
VVDDEKHLLGVVSIRTLLLSLPKQKIEDLMSKVVKTLRLHTKFEDIARLMTKYDLLSMAVVDRHKVIRGIVTVDDILRFLIPDA